jgi:hypothetical protein
MVVTNFNVESMSGFPIEFSQSEELGKRLGESVNQLRMMERRMVEPSVAPQFAYLASAMWGGRSPEPAAQRWN